VRHLNTGRPTTARQDILSKINVALSATGPDHGTRASTEADEGMTGNGTCAVSAIEARCSERRVQLAAQFERELLTVGGNVHHVSSSQAACNCIVKIAFTQSARKAIAWNVALINELGLAHRLAEERIQFVSCCEEIGGEEFAEGEGMRLAFLQHAEAADIGVTSVDYALADTGTLVLRTGNGRARSTSLLPPVHIALLRPAQIISGLDDLFPLLARDNQSAGGLDSALTFITGPSRTADIELTLVVGVHGPQELHVILLDEEDLATEGS